MSQPFIGVDLGGTNIMVGILASDNKLLGKARNKTKADRGEDTVIQRIVRTIDEALDDAKLTLKDVAGLGLGAPGTVDHRTGIVTTAPNLRWNDFPVTKVLSEELGIPVILENDANVGVWGEYCVGAGRGFDSVLGIFVGTGIGGGIVLDGRLYHGQFGTAGEIGHTVIRADAPRGWRTAENCASRTALANSLRELIRANHPSALTDITDGNLHKIRSGSLAQAIQQNDALTLEVVQTGARYVGILAANVVTVLSLPCVVLGGGLTEALGKTYTQWVRQSFDRNVFPPTLSTCKIIPAALGDDAGIIGAALLARARIPSKT